MLILLEMLTKRLLQPRRNLLIIHRQRIRPGNFERRLLNSIARQALRLDNPVDTRFHFLSCFGVAGPDVEGYARVVDDHVLGVAGLDAGDCYDGGVPGVDFAGDDGLEFHDCACGHDDGVDEPVWHAGVSASAVEGNAHAVCCGR